MDIIETSEGSRNGYLAVDAIDYAKCILHILDNSKDENETIRNAARLVLVCVTDSNHYISINIICLLIFYRASCDRFSEEEFKHNFLRAVTLLYDE